MYIFFIRDDSIITPTKVKVVGGHTIMKYYYDVHKKKKPDYRF